MQGGNEIFCKDGERRGWSRDMTETKEPISPEVWEAVKIASIRGVPDVQLSEQYGVTREAIRQRRCRDKVWAAAVSPVSMLHNEDRKAEASRLVTECPETAEIAQKVASTVSENISRLGEQNRLLALQIAGKGLKQANAAPPDVQSWQDVKALMDIVSKASGMESGNAVQVNVLSSGPVDFVPGFGVQEA